MEYSEVQTQHAIRPGEIVFEIDNEHLIVKTEKLVDPVEPFNPKKVRINRKEYRSGNSHQIFPPVESRSTGAASVNYVRTRNDFGRVPKDERFTYDRALHNIDVIPGERIHLDPVKRIGRITDAIFDPENDSIYTKLIDASNNLARKFMLQPGEYLEVDLRDDYAYWNWVWHMRLIADGDALHNGGPDRHRGCANEGPRLCRPIQNMELLPTREECAKSLKVRERLSFLTKEDFEDFEKERKENDPDFRTGERNKVTITPYLAGVGARD